MKILLLTAIDRRFGTWFRTFNLAAGLVKRGHQVTFMRISGDRHVVPRHTVEEGVSIYEVPRFWGATAVFHSGTRMPVDIAVRVLMQLVNKYDVVHSFTHYLNAILPALIARQIRRSPVFVGDRDDLWTDGGLMGAASARGVLATLDYKFSAWTEKNMGRWLGAMTVVSEDLRERELANGVEPGRVKKIINGCPVDQIAPGDKVRARTALDLPQDRQIALFVGVGQYDVDLIFEALKRFRASHPDRPMPLTLFVGPHGRKLREMAQERGVAEFIRATDDVVSGPELLVYLHAADVGLLPFADKPLNWARWPIKLGDYLAAGLPILTNAVGEMGRVVAEEEVGEVTASDAQAFADGLARLLVDDARLRTLGARARAAAVRLNWDAVAGELEEFYVHLGAGGGRVGAP